MKKNILFEDATMYYNKWVSGQASKEFGTTRVKFKDIIARGEEGTDQNPNISKADNVLPYPMPSAIPILGELVISTSNALTMFRTALKNPTVQDNPKARAEIVATIKALKKSLHELNLLFIRFHKDSKES